jgi:3-oxoacyl-[acyl-carrier protein] reductase
LILLPQFLRRCTGQCQHDEVARSRAGPEVRVLAVAPGVVDTAFVPGCGADFNDKTANTTPLQRIALPIAVRSACGKRLDASPDAFRL